MSIDKCDSFFSSLFFGFWTTLFQVQFIRNPFNIDLVEVQKHIILKSHICDNNFGHRNVFSPKFQN
jgi:hypothetical protein